jgi:small subunit ribosomal protein S20
MPNSKAARKAELQSRKRALKNSGVRSRLKTLAKKLQASGGDMQGVRCVAIEYISALDKAVKRGVVHRNFANRRKRGTVQYLAV